MVEGGDCFAKSERVALVVGGTSGIGLATSELLGARGWMVVASGTRVARGGGDAAPETRENVQFEYVDVTSPESVNELVGKATAKGSLDLVVYASGVNTKDREIDRLSEDDWEKLYSVNLRGAYFLTKSIEAIFRSAGRGCFIVIGTLATLYPDRSGVAYQASKAGLAALAKAFYLESGEHGTRVGIVYPGLTRTDFVRFRRAAPSEGEMAGALDRSDIARACLTIAELSDQAGLTEIVLRPRVADFRA